MYEVHCVIILLLIIFFVYYYYYYPKQEHLIAADWVLTSSGYNVPFTNGYALPIRTLNAMEKASAFDIQTNY